MLVCPACVSLRAGANLWAAHFSCNDIAKRGPRSIWYQMTVLYDLFNKAPCRDLRRRCCWSFSEVLEEMVSYVFIKFQLCFQKSLSRVNKTRFSFKNL